MKQAAAHTTTGTGSGDPGLALGTVALTFLDTTWRIATPVVLFTLLGIFIDLQLGTKPWLTLLAVMAGFAMAILLVKRQIEAVVAADKAAAHPKKKGAQ
jgi:hypothetical protein